MKAILTCTSVALLALGVSAANATTINGSDFASGVHSEIINGVNFVAGPNSQALLQTKQQSVSNGVGVNGLGVTAGEIDIQETITATIQAGPQTINSITFGLLFDGPEYSDVHEKAIVTIGNGHTGTLTATSISTANWNFDNINYAAILVSQAADGLGGVWTVNDPFAGTKTATLVFGAATGTCYTVGGCSSQSDYTLNKLVYGEGINQTSVPEPTSLGLLAAGMIGLGIARRRSRKS